MNKKELCVIINHNKIYLECILADYEYVPIFFLCKSEYNEFYLSLCRNPKTAEKYIVVKLPKEEVKNLIYGQLPMRDVFLNQESFWKVFSGDKVENDIVIEYPIEQIPKDDLPYEGACYKIFEEYVRKYVESTEI